MEWRRFEIDCDRNLRSRWSIYHRGKGRMVDVAIGALIMSVITYFISMIPGMSVWQKSLQGGIIIVAVAINYFTEQSAKRQALKERSALI